MEADFSEVLALEADLRAVPPEANRRVRKALEVTARGVKDDWRQGATISGSYAKSYAGSISYDIGYPGGAIEAIIGPVLGRTPGAGAGFLEEGGGGVDGPPHHAGRDALEANEADFYRGLEIAIAEAVIDKVGGGG